MLKMERYYWKFSAFHKMCMLLPMHCVFHPKMNTYTQIIFYTFGDCLVYMNRRKKILTANIYTTDRRIK